MSIKFTDLQGKASKSGPKRFKPVDGENRFRIVGSVLPGYKYWLKSKDGMNIPLDCLSFDRENEQFNNALPDPVRKHFPEEKCSWAYQSFVIDRSDGQVKIFDHKKKLFEEILHVAKKKFGDPTDPEKGWDVVFTRTKTGPHTYNVEYKLEVFEIESSPLSDEDKKAVEEAGKIEDIVKIPTVEEQEEFIQKYILSDEVDEDVADELDDDIPM